MYIIYRSPEIRPVSLGKGPNVWGRLKKGFTSWKKPSSRMSAELTKPLNQSLPQTPSEPQLPPPTKERKGGIFSKLCNWTKRKEKKKTIPKPKARAKKSKKGCFPSCSCCKRKPRPIEPSGESCWRTLFCLDRACCAKCKKTNKPAPEKVKEKSRHSSFAGLPKLEPTLVEHTSVMKGAIPVLPRCLAWMCLLINVFLPGIGTLTSGFLCLCFGKPRFSVNDSAHARLGAFCVNLIVAVSQLFTVIFCLVGWGWSIWWGVIMIRLARKNRRLKLAEKNADHPVPVAVNQNHDVERGER